MTKPDGIELALFACLRYEEASLKYADAKQRWNMSDEEKQAVLKWMNVRMEEIKDRLDG